MMIRQMDGYIYLYAAEGADSSMVRDTRKSLESFLGSLSNKLIAIDDASYIHSRSLQSVKAVVIPGGSAPYINSSLKEEGIKKIYDFVTSQGGSYIGFCAGAYLAGPFYYFDWEEVNLGLNLVKQPLFGPFGETVVREFNAKSVLALRIMSAKNEKKYTVFWNGGGYYPAGASLKEEPLAFYEGEGSSKIAALVSHEHKGRVVICNVHPEVQLNSLEIKEQLPYLENGEELEASVPEQKALFAEICKAALI